MQTVQQAPPPVITPTAPPAPPAPPAPAVVTKASSVKGNLQGLISGDDYPADAQRNDEQGSVRVNLAIGTDGRVTNCSVTKSSGSRSLDSATCRILKSRARFTPAKLSNGQATTDNFPQTITWRLEG
ncbi:energy transducer TonB [Sphingomonas daechungensis]|uniref:energy transducer TonB n=1 Tax=Sphingomonas daechungensis TaxID=1176646 RepID=UPI0029500704|nr:energy transducer TonB [Sphingomonas daechungensis]